MGTQIEFGTDGWRAVIAADYTFDNVRLCTQAVADYVLDSGMADRGMVIGYDTRFQSEYFASAVAEVFAGNGIKAYLSDRPIPTPTTSFAILTLKAAGGVIITASHNPSIWNGFKYRPEYAGAASPEITEAVEERLAEIQAQDGEIKRLPLEEGIEQGIIVKIDAVKPYLEQVASLVDLEAIRQAELLVAVDAMYGAGIGYFPKLLSGGKTQVVEVNNVRNPLFPGMENPEPIDHNLKALKRAIAEHDADAGLGNDGDADRIGFMDENGVFINQLQVYALLLLYLLEVKEKRGPIVRTITSSVMADKLAAKYDLDVYETPVGFKYVGPKMLEVDALMGGEESGGFAFAGHLPERDGILAGLMLLELMVKLDKKPSELIDYLYEQVGPHYYDRWDIEFEPENRQQVIQAIDDEHPDEIAGLKVVSEDRPDGAFRFHLEDGGWLLVRFSGTEPLIRIYTETTHKEKVEEILQSGKELAGLA
jgi:alpha-D-glucose phosphate-specific phosphoglucomutase